MVQKSLYNSALIILIGFFSVSVFGQSFFEYSDTLNKKRRNIVWGTEILGSVSSLALLNTVWYKNFPRTSMHSFNDNDQWLLMDKTGHMMTSYYVGLAGIETMKWSGVKSKPAALVGGSLGLIYLTGVELLDGTSAAWGFSWGDMAANASGFLLAGGQELLWQKQKIKLKVSAHLTNYAYYRPNVLGATIPERLLKDYNGQTYWLSANLKSLFFQSNEKFPAWLNIALGYGAEEMITGSEDADFCTTHPDLCGAYNRYGQGYLSLDVDLTQIAWKRKIFKTIFGSFGWIKFPAPTLEFSRGKIKGHWIYF
jgi:uncharacterized protein YfiM (DUF2279 family)